MASKKFNNVHERGEGTYPNVGLGKARLRQSFG